MSTLKTLIPLSGIALALAAILWSGCGLMTAPITGPAAIASNANFSFKGTVVDSAGQPLDGVLMSQVLHHRFWTPSDPSTDTDERHLIRIDRTFSVGERGHDLTLTFTHDGFYEAQYSFDSNDEEIVHTPLGNWPNRHDFPVVLLAKAPRDADLNFWSGGIDYSHYPNAYVVNLGVIDMHRTPEVAENIDDAASFPSGVLYLTLTKEPLPANNARGEVDPIDVNLPGQITLHIAGPQNGFIRIEPRLGYAPMQVSDTAPDGPYLPELTITRKRLREMRTTDPHGIIEAHEYFYFRANNCFGKGWIAWSQSISKEQKEVLPTAFRYAIWIQKNENDRNLISRQAVSQ